MRIIEAGHYYLSKGPTVWSKIGWEILEKIKSSDDKTLLFIDDIHKLEDVFIFEKNLPNINFNPNPDYLMMESEMEFLALEVLSRLKKVSVLKSKNGVTKWHGFNIFDKKGCSCVLLDAGLILKKYELGFFETVNILPFFYQLEQKRLLEIIKKVIPEIQLKIIFFNSDGFFWEMQEQ